MAAFWSAADLLRPLGLLYALHLFVARLPEVAHPERGWTVLAVLAVWTAATFVVRRRTPFWLGAELLLSVAAILATALVDSEEVIRAGAPTIPGLWPAATVLSWAVLSGPGAGAAAAGVVAVADLVLIREPGDVTVHNIVLLLLLGTLVGWCADLARTADRAVREAAEVEARAAERVRLARDVHDGVLQALAYVHRRGSELGGEAADLARLAAQQEARLRELIQVPERVTAGPPAPETSSTTVDLAELARARARERVSVVTTGPVMMQSHRAHEVDAAIGAAIDNVVAHAPGARAWILLDREGEDVVVMIRDDGPGIPEGRLDEARRQGRLGVASSIMGRMTDLGGTARYDRSGQGTRLELRAPLTGPETGR